MVKKKKNGQRAAKKSAPPPTHTAQEETNPSTSTLRRLLKPLWARWLVAGVALVGGAIPLAIQLDDADLLPTAPLIYPDPDYAAAEGASPLLARFVIENRSRFVGLGDVTFTCDAAIRYEGNNIFRGNQVPSQVVAIGPHSAARVDCRYQDVAAQRTPIGRRQIEVAEITVTATSSRLFGPSTTTKVYTFYRLENEWREGPMPRVRNTRRSTSPSTR